MILARVGNLPLEVDGGRYILKRSTETTVSRGIRGLPINRIEADPLIHMFLLTCSIMRCIIQTRKHSKIAIRGVGKMAKTKAEITNYFRYVLDGIRKSPFIDECKEMVFGNTGCDTPNIKYGFRVLDFTGGNIICEATITWAFPFGEFEWARRRGESIGKISKIPEDMWESKICRAIRNSAKYLAELAKEYTDCAAPNMVNRIRFQRDVRMISSQMYSVDALYELLQKKLQETVSERFSDWGNAEGTETETNDGIEFITQAYELPKITLDISRKADRVKENSNYHGVSIAGSCIIRRKTSQADVTQNFVDVIAIKDILALSWDADTAAEKMVELLWDAIQMTIDKARSRLVLKESRPYRDRELESIPALMDAVSRFRKLKNVEPKLFVLKIDGKKKSFVSGTYCFVETSENHLNLCKVRKGSSPNVTCFSLGQKEKYDPKISFPMYQEDLPAFARYFQRVFEESLPDLHGLNLENQQFTVELVNLLDKNGDQLGPEYDQSRCRAKLRISAYKEEKGQFVSVESCVYDSNTKVNTREYIRRAILKCLDKDTMKKAQQDAIQQKLKNAYSDWNLPQKAILYVLAQDTRTHSFSQILSDVKKLWTDVSIKDDAVEEAFDALCEKNVSALGESYQLIVSRRVQSMYKNFNAFGLSKRFGNSLNIDKPIPGIKDLWCVTTKSKGAIISRLASEATTDDDRWNVLNALLETESKSEISRFVESDVGKKFLARINAEERDYARMRLEVMGKFGRNVLDLFQNEK